MRIAIVQEGFNQDEADPVVIKKVRSAAEHFTALGASVEEVSIPMHLMGGAIFLPSAIRNFTDIMVGRGGLDTEGKYIPSMVEATTRWRERPNELPHNVKILLMAGHFLKGSNGREIYAKAKNLSNQLRSEYDRVLSEYDLLLMPTTLSTAPQIPPVDASCDVVIEHALSGMANTSQFDLTGHPAMSVPCGMINDLPLGMMLVGKHLDESTIYRAAHAFEQSTDWRKL